ncbi:MAG: hypothetical protein ABWZ77_06145 [Naasia sp.]
MAAGTVSEDLSYSGGGRIHVTTEEVERTAQWLRRCSAEARRVQRALEAVETAHPVSVDPNTWSARGIGGEIAPVTWLLGRQSQALADLADSIVVAWDRYYWGEVMSQRAISLLQSTAASAAGAMTTVALAALLLANPWLTAVIAYWMTRPSEPSRPASSTKAENSDESGAERSTGDPLSILTHPTAVALTRDGIDHTDDFVRGMMLMPPWLSQLLDDDATGLFGKQETAALVAAALAALGVKEGPVVATQVSGTRYPAASQRPGSAHTLQDHVAQIPAGDPDDGRLTVTQVEHDDGTRSWVVYLGGTTLEDRQAMDMLSNIRLEAGLIAGSERAAQQAMAAAGVEAGDRVSFVGYSQGGLLATRLIESGQWQTEGLLTVGSPGTWLNGDPEFPQLALEHSEDVIAGLNGRVDPTDSGPIIVTRSALDGELGDGALGGHHIDDYIDTAAAVDADRDAMTAAQRDRFLAATAGTLVSTATFTLERVPPPASPAPAPTPTPSPGPTPVPPGAAASASDQREASGSRR